MADEAQKIYLIRHGETEWSRAGKHTGVTDVPLSEQGRKTARLLRPVLAREKFVLVLCSPLQRARETCELAGLQESAVVDPDLMEWRYGEYEGLTTKQIQLARPGWSVFHDGCPGAKRRSRLPPALIAWSPKSAREMATSRCSLTGISSESLRHAGSISRRVSANACCSIPRR